MSYPPTTCRQYGKHGQVMPMESRVVHKNMFRLIKCAKSLVMTLLVL